MSMGRGYVVTSGGGGAKAKEGPNVLALNRASGYSATLSACHSRTRTLYPSSGKAYHWVGCEGYGGNENIVGYNPGNGGSKMPGGYSKHY